VEAGAGEGFGTAFDAQLLLVKTGEVRLLLCKEGVLLGRVEVLAPLRQLVALLEPVENEVLQVLREPAALLHALKVEAH